MILSRNQTLRALSILVCFLALSALRLHANLSSLAKNDPYPVYDSLDPHTFLYTAEKLKIKEPELAKRVKDSVGISFSPFGQNAINGRNIDCQKVTLGDLNGRWDMIALMFGPIPPGKTMAPALQTALTNLFPGVVPGTLNDPTAIDPNQRVGFFSVPVKYKKRGIRFDLEANIIGGFGLQFQMGVASMTQTVTAFEDLTDCTVTTDCKFDPSYTTANVEKYLMKELKVIAKEIQLDICDFSETSVEEVRFNLFWRQGYNLNEDEEGWPQFLFIPFFEVGGSVSPGAIKDPNKAGFNQQFAVPFGNNGFNALGFCAGINIDFVQSMELGVEVGTTYFLKKNFDNYRVPTSACQSGIYPFRTDVTIKPGINWHFGGKISAYHFLDRLSGWFQYIQLQHMPDDITLRNCQDDGVFLPGLLECRSGFKVKLADVGFNYDISPNIGIGFFWQAPLSQSNAYKATTVMFSLNTTF